MDVSLLLKPVSNNCNLDCTYCFYNDIVSFRNVVAPKVMSEDIVETIIERAIEITESYRCSIIFQGGEPMLAGLSFYRNFIKILKSKNHFSNFSFNIQTNGTLINQEWIDFFKEYNFLVGISIDGPEEIHDKNRLDLNKIGSFNRVMDAVQLIKENKINYNILCVITKNSVHQAKKLYDFFKVNNFKFLQFIPCLDLLGEITNSRSPNPIDFGNFLCELFEEYLKDFKNGHFVSIRYFDNLIEYLKGGCYESCEMNGICSIQYVIETDGRVYPCDFYVLDSFCLGNIKNESLREMAMNQVARNFVSASMEIPNECLGCDYFAICRNGCRKVRDDLGINQYCSSYKMFFDSNYHTLRELIKL